MSSVPDYNEPLSAQAAQLRQEADALIAVQNYAGALPYLERALGALSVLADGQDPIGQYEHDREQLLAFIEYIKTRANEVAAANNGISQIPVNFIRSRT